ncbi:EutN/CcmL family microcompartment protein [Alkalicoccus chagannorensis]|uniref:EutN/CcmL family microcompartment protein n=1 Tax=Alkalicoccus chagannorensis TaxID=427072 RepID=UPI000425AB55|nr:EutN/CcmL family microcompartment protein [Alkalicoccus chagannorensis]
MYAAKVTGSVVSTHKDKSLHGLKLLVIQPVNDQLELKGKPLIAVDTVGQAGYGDYVYVAKSNEAGMPLHRDMVAADAGIMGIIDHYSVSEEEL